MINIRYHIVSITAVFLALGIGVALGGTFLDKATVSVLDNNITSAEKRIKETNAENDRLNEQVTKSKARDASLILEGSESLVADELTDLPVLVVAAPGVDSDTIDEVSTILERTGAEFRGTIQLSDKLAFDGDVDGDVDLDLATDLGITDPDQARLRAASATALTDALMAAGLSLSEDGTTPAVADPTTTTTTLQRGANPSCCSAEPPAGDQPPIIDILAERGYLKLEPGPGYTEDDPILEAVGYRYVYLGGPELDDAQNQTLLSVLPDTGAAMPATVISASQAAPEAEEAIIPTVVARVRESDDLRQRYSTVDDTETFAGLVAMVFTLRDMGVVDPGQYGQASGASAVLPPTS